MAARYGSLLLAAVLLAVVASERGAAHKPVTSKYDYNKDIFPLLLAHCARCHAEGGSAPMSLMTYQQAVPWAESIREELTSGRMPPWPVDPASPAVAGGFPISSRDLDKVVVWAAGGTPQGDPGATLPAVTLHPQWKLGPPDLLLPLNAEYTLSPGAMEATREYSLAVTLTDTKWIKAADLMPGNATIVRDAVIRIENGPVLALWQPGGENSSAPDGSGFRLAPGSNIKVQIHYKKHYDQEQKAESDKSTVGLYFTQPPASGRELQSLTIEMPKGNSDAGGSQLPAAALPTAARVLALRPMLDRAYAALDVDAVLASGARVPLLRLRGARPQWLRRYWLQQPVELPGSSRIEVRATPLSDDSDEPILTQRLPFQVILDYLPQSAPD